MSADNYSITMSSDAWLSTVAALLTSLRDDRRELDRLPLMPGWAEWINSEIALKSEAIQALNLAKVVTREDTHGALDGQNLRTAIMALHFMLHSLKHGPFANVSDVLAGQVIASPDALNAALLFLENPK